jgi:CRISPR-associated protein Csb2
VLAIRCELLLGSYQAADPFGSAETVEWPPHPFRLHAALVGAACEAGGEQPDPAAVEALQWLERQAPPAITCDEAPSRRTVATSWVPRNITRGGELDRTRKAGASVSRVGRVFPTAVPANPGITFTWAVADRAPEVLANLASGVTWLGSSRSPVACGIITTETPPTFLPSSAGSHQLRVASHGLTEALLGARFVHPQPISGLATGYSTPSPASPPSVAAPFSELLVRRVLAATQDTADAAVLGEALRAAVLARAGDDAPAALHGHAPGREHAAYLTLTDVGHREARGLVHGVAVALPSDLDAEERKACAQAFLAVDPLVLPGGRRPLRLSDDISPLWVLSPERWIGPSTHWSTVTPVILDRFPRRGRTTRDELLATLDNAGLPEPEELELLAGPPSAGAPRAGGLRGTVPPGQRVHVRLRFASSVRGPVLAGRGRFRGIGVFVPERRG